MSFPKIEHQMIQVKRGGRIRNPVLAHWKRHHVKLLSGFDQRINSGEAVISSALADDPFRTRDVNVRAQLAANGPPTPRP